jgi:hypothetical protein
VTESSGTGAGALRLSMKTCFVSDDRPRVAAAKMVGCSFPCRRWAASMRHCADGPGRSRLIYTYTFEVGPPVLRWLREPPVIWVFHWQTRRRFARLRSFLTTVDIEHWQSGGVTR